MAQTCPGSVVSTGFIRSQRGLIALLVGLALSVGVSLRAQAATTWTVCASGCDYSRIKAAIAAPTTRDGDTLALAAGTYTEPGIVVNKSLTLQGEGAATTVVQAKATEGPGQARVFTIPGGVTVALRALTIRYGSIGGQGYPPAYGGGLYNECTLTLTHSTVSGNSAYWSGGGVYNGGTLTLTHSTVSGNAVKLVGGGLYNVGTLTLTHSTVSGNIGANGSLANESTLTLTNSLVADNPIGGDCVNVSTSSVISQGYNLDSDGSCQLIAPTDRPGVDPRLGPLQDNGGPTFTHALLPGSPAIDAIPRGTNGCGTTTYSDQRWQARPQPARDACDIGAYEVEAAGQSLSAWVTGLTPHTAVCQNTTTGQAVTLSALASPWDCMAAGFIVSSGDQVALRVRGPAMQGATDVGGAVVGMVPSGGGCTNRTTGQQVTFQHMVGATAASCVAAGLVVQEGEAVQLRVQGAAE